ncbi:sulfite oxidase [Bacillus sp. 31A1R]|uniref:Sulfite oxidase n=1 Tax=Robertmurraya mangrovi TaxID=3098077 RepID=A0ABU5J538_9BACI|nr:sulfite oxidase [Bacillus sp. 31A1R]MDZ5474530.1 sulfite oxidase [Bacillus sp. 31A1R]
MHQVNVIPYLTTKNLNPENQESPIHFLSKWKTPEEYFYLRNHFSYPHFYDMHFGLMVDGLVSNTTFISYRNILSMKSKSIVVPLECAGNKRSKFVPKVYGEQWEEGAISQGKWRGISLRDLLSPLHISPTAKEIVFIGKDFGKRTDMLGLFYYARSLPISKALDPDTLIAYEYNDKPITFKHGFPLRLIVPSWYAMASVKWLQWIVVIDHEFNGPFQNVDYVYYPNKETDKGKFPVTVLIVNSTIQKPLDFEILDTGKHVITGIAWTGKGTIKKVEISTDNGKTWNTVFIKYLSNESYSWVRWSYEWEVKNKGEYTIKSRATDSEGRVQPEEPFWNRKGYGYNAVSSVTVKVE